MLARCQQRNGSRLSSGRIEYRALFCATSRPCCSLDICGAACRELAGGGDQSYTACCISGTGGTLHRVGSVLFACFAFVHQPGARRCV
jgi:hypothetical protein